MHPRQLLRDRNLIRKEESYPANIQQRTSTLKDRNKSQMTETKFIDIRKKEILARSHRDLNSDRWSPEC